MIKRLNSNKRILFASILVLSAFLLSAGCTQSGGDNKSSLSIVMNFGPDTGGSLDPANGWEGWYVKQAGIYETLFYGDENMEIKPELATGYTHVNDTVWEITLRDDVYFHDGTKMDADAVIFSLNRVLDPSNDRSYEYDFIKEIRKTGDYTIEIETTEPYAPLIASLIDPIMSIVSPNIADVDTQPDGTGPYAFVSYEPGASIDLVANENYWKGDVLNKNLYMSYNSDAATRTLMLKSGDVDIAKDILPSEYAALESSPDTDVFSKETLRAYFIYINAHKAPFDDARVRQALYYATDRQEIVDTALEGVAGSPASAMFTNTMPWNANDMVEQYDYNPEKALELFAEAGITQGGDGKLYYNGEPFSVEIQTYPNRAALPASLEVIAAQWEKIGIDVVTKIADSSAINADVKSGDYDMALYTWNTAPTGDPDYFLSGHCLSTGTYASTWLNYSNPQVDEWILEARATFDEDKRAELYDDVQVRVMEDAPMIFVFYAVENDATRSDVTGFQIYPNDYTFVTKDIAAV